MQNTAKSPASTLLRGSEEFKFNVVEVDGAASTLTLGGGGHIPEYFVDALFRLTPVAQAGFYG